MTSTNLLVRSTSIARDTPSRWKEQPLNQTRPVVALDVDGVLNAFRMDPLQPGWSRFDVEMRAENIPDSPSAYGPETITVTLNPALHGPWIAALRQQADVVWATTWEQAANDLIAPLLGIEPLPVGISATKQPPTSKHLSPRDSTAWKGEALSAAFPDRALVWVDDQNLVYADALDVQEKLVIDPDPWLGLTPAQMEQVETWVKTHA